MSQSASPLSGYHGCGAVVDLVSACFVVTKLSGPPSHFLGYHSGLETNGGHRQLICFFWVDVQLSSETEDSWPLVEASGTERCISFGCLLRVRMHWLVNVLIIVVYVYSCVFVAYCQFSRIPPLGEPG